MKQKQPIVFLLSMCLSVVLVMALETEDAPNSKLNPESGNIETVDPVLNGSNQNLRYVIDEGIGTSPTVTTISSHANDDRNPRLVIADNGDAWVAWWRDGQNDTVVVRKRNYSNGSWDSESQVSEDDPGGGLSEARYPSITHDGTRLWVAYEVIDAEDIVIVTHSVIDDPDPITAAVEVARTASSGSNTVLVRSEAGRVWVTWVDSASDVGWSVYDDASGTWNAASYESYATDTVDDARSRIRTTVLAP